MTQHDFNMMADKLRETWRNGNKSDVLAALSEMEPLEAAAAAVFIFGEMSSLDPITREQETFALHLRSKVVE